MNSAAEYQFTSITVTSNRISQKVITFELRRFRVRRFVLDQNHEHFTNQMKKCLCRPNVTMSVWSERTPRMGFYDLCHSAMIIELFLSLIDFVDSRLRRPGQPSFSCCRSASRSACDGRWRFHRGVPIALSGHWVATHFNWKLCTSVVTWTIIMTRRKLESEAIQ